MIASHFFLFWRRCWRRPSLCMGERTNGGIWKLSRAKNFGQISRRSKMLEEFGGGGQNVSELAKCTSIGWQEEEVGQVSRGWGVLCAILCFYALCYIVLPGMHRATLWCCASCYIVLQWISMQTVCCVLHDESCSAFCCSEIKLNGKSKDLNKIKHISQMTSLVLSEVQLEHCLSAVCKLCRLRGKERFTSAITGSEVAETGE